VRRFIASRHSITDGKAVFDMTTPHVTEVRRPLEAVSPDPFVNDLTESVRPDRGAPDRGGEDRDRPPED
jgi:hypothetical protein